MFKDFINFLLNYWHYIITAISIVLMIFSAIFKGNKKARKLFQIMSVLPEVIIKAERLFPMSKSGLNKLDWCLSQIQVICSEFKLGFDSSFWTDKIEEYLSTPQKK